jgi:hypothetical protein
VGAYYAQVLNTVAPYVKRYYPNVKFIAGAAREPHSGFLDQVIEDAWSNIDVLSYHRYVTSYDLNCEIPHYLSTQQSGFGYVRNALNTRTANDIVAGMATPTPKPILISEGAMKYGNAELNPPPPAFYDCQAKYARNLLTWLKVQATPGSLKGFIWYTVGFNGWYYTDLLNMDTPTPTPTRRNYVNLVATPTPTPKYTPMPVYFVWKDWVPPVFVPLLVNNYHFDNSPYSGMSVSGQSESGAYPAPLDDSAPGIDQPPDQNNQAPYPAPDLMEDSASGVDMPLEQYTPTPPITPFPTETPTPDIDPALEQYSPTSYPTPAL